MASYPIPGFIYLKRCKQLKHHIESYTINFICCIYVHITAHNSHNANMSKITGFILYVNFVILIMGGSSNILVTLINVLNHQ